jgi:hypothetical protein
MFGDSELGASVGCLAFTVYFGGERVDRPFSNQM